MIASELVAEVKKRFGDPYLIQVTNSDSSATSINDTVLEAAATDSLGEFIRGTGFAPDASLPHHISLLCRGTVYLLEFYKARDVNVLQSRQRDFYSGLNSLKKYTVVDPITNSNLTYDSERAGSRADMARNRNLFRSGGRPTMTPPEVFTE